MTACERPVRDFLKVALLGYWNPARFAEAVRDVPTPGWGLLAVLIRAALDSLLIYLPPALMGWQPWPAPTITLLHAETYYWSLVWFTPFYMLFLWVYLAGVTHVALRLTGRRTDMDFVLGRMRDTSHISERCQGATGRANG